MPEKEALVKAWTLHGEVMNAFFLGVANIRGVEFQIFGNIELRIISRQHVDRRVFLNDQQERVDRDLCAAHPPKSSLFPKHYHIQKKPNKEVLDIRKT